MICDAAHCVETAAPRLKLGKRKFTNTAQFAQTTLKKRLRREEKLQARWHGT
jgi:hypothetical protein